MTWMERVNGSPVDWLLEHDPANPGVRRSALTSLAGLEASTPEVEAAQFDVFATGPVAAILAAQSPDGYWGLPEDFYRPKYRGTGWQIVFLAQFGATGDDHRVRAACEYMLDHGRNDLGAFSYEGTRSTRIQCMEGNLIAALLALGYGDDKRLAEAIDWLARSVAGAGLASADERDAPRRFYRSGNSGPGFNCSANNHRPCAWGAVKAMLALGRIPVATRTPEVRSAIEAGVEFLLGVDPATAAYPTATDTKPNRSWFRFGYPIGYVTDVLQNVEALIEVGAGVDSRLDSALEYVLSKQDRRGRWQMEYGYNGKTWTDVETPGEPSKWVTLRALRALNAVDRIRGDFGA
ncbi:MAG: nitrogen fixation protein NifH [Coriobacteriia bacterium]